MEKIGFTQDFKVLKKYTTGSGNHIEKQIKGYTGKAHSKDYGFEVGKCYRIYYNNDHNGCATIFDRFEQIANF